MFPGSKKSVGLGCAAFVLFTLGASETFAYSFGAEYIDDWGARCGCGDEYRDDLTCTGD